MKHNTTVLTPYSISQIVKPWVFTGPSGQWYGQVINLYWEDYADGTVPPAGTPLQGVTYTGGSFCTLTANYLWFDDSAYYYFASWQNSPYVNITRANYTMMTDYKKHLYPFQGLYMQDVILSDGVVLYQPDLSYTASPTFLEWYALKVTQDPSPWVTSVMLGWALQFFPPSYFSNTAYLSTGNSISVRQVAKGSMNRRGKDLISMRTITPASESEASSCPQNPTN